MYQNPTTPRNNPHTLKLNNPVNITELWSVPSINFFCSPKYKIIEPLVLWLDRCTVC